MSSFCFLWWWHVSVSAASASVFEFFDLLNYLQQLAHAVGQELRLCLDVETQAGARALHGGGGGDDEGDDDGGDDGGGGGDDDGGDDGGGGGGMCTYTCNVRVHDDERERERRPCGAMRCGAKK